ncbi:MAG: biotin transporter BioY [Candidatus Gastranaerophilales bacterium]|nr:biotin transporter BioY [Candidatus Gastranaerophilales bacterium]
MTKRLEEQLNYFRYKGEPVKFRLGTLILIALSVLLIIMATFTELHFTHFYIPIDIIPHWGNYITDEGINLSGFIKTVKYIPQVPVIFFILGLLDRKYSIVTVLIYMILGFTQYPIFAMGGGWRYIFQYGVGYILAYLPALFFAGSILNRKYNFTNILKSVIAGVVIINIIGALVLLIIACLKHENGLMIKNLLYSMSGFKFIYDIIFSVIAIYLSLIVKRIFWIILS